MAGPIYQLTPIVLEASFIGPLFCVQIYGDLSNLYEK